MASTTSDLQLLGRKLGALDYNPDLYVKEIARRSVGGHDLLHQRNNIKVKFIYSEKGTKFCEISTLLLTGTTLDKSKVEISQNFMAFSEHMNFTT